MYLTKVGVLIGFAVFSVSTWIFHVSDDDATNYDQQFIPFYCGMQIGTSPVSRKFGNFEKSMSLEKNENFVNFEKMVSFEKW